MIVVLLLFYLILNLSIKICKKNKGIDVCGLCGSL